MRSLTHLNAINKFHLGAALSLPNATKLSWPACWLHSPGNGAANGAKTRLN